MTTIMYGSERNLTQIYDRTMSSVTILGHAADQLWTAIVNPNKIREISRTRDQVLIGRRSFFLTAASTFFNKCKVDKRTLFLVNRWHSRFLLITLVRRRYIRLSVRLLLRVLYPLVGTPPWSLWWRPPLLLTFTHPPCGWFKLGSCAEPRER